MPPKLNPSNDWTSRYLQDVLGEAALSDPDIRAHLDRSGTRNHPGRAGTAAANAPAHVQPSLASGSNAQAPSYNIDPQTAAERKRAMEDAEKALEYHEGGAKRARRFINALGAMDFDDDDEEKDEGKGKKKAEEE